MITAGAAGGVAAAYLILGQRDRSPPDSTLAEPTMPGNREHNGATAGATPLTGRELTTLTR